MEVASGERSIAASCGDGDALAAAARYLRALWPERPGYAARLEELRTRLVEERLQVAVLGQFKRGKSTFLNALLGQAVLPTGVVPLTAVATFLRWGAVPSIEIGYADGRPVERVPVADPPAIRAELFRLVTEAGNPRNRANIARVEVFLPAPILERGIVLIDTPGIGSTLRHNTDAALAVLPECDAAFFVLSADPPVTAAELEYLERIRPQVARLFFVLNKIDYLDESDRHSVVDFLRASLSEHVPAEAAAPIFCLSARRGLDAKERGDGAGVVDSGLAAIERQLGDFLAGEKFATLQRAVGLKACELLDAAGMETLLGVRALGLPIDDLEQRAAQFVDELVEIERQRQVAGDLLAGDRRRMIEMLEADAAALRREARVRLDAVVAAAFAGGDPRQSEQAAKTAIAEAIPAFFAPQMAAIAGKFGDQVEKVLAGHIRRAEALVAAVRQTAAALFEIASIPAGGAEVFAIAREPYWVTQKWDETINTLAETALGRVLPPAARARRAERRLSAQIDDLVQRNVENLRWATLQNLENALRRFSAWFDDRLGEAIRATRGALDAAIVKRRDHTLQAEDELARLRAAAAWIATARRDFAAEATPAEPAAISLV